MSSSAAPTPSYVRSATSRAWSTSFPPSRARPNLKCRTTISANWCERRARSPDDRSDVVFETKVGKEPIIVSCDRRLISQAVTNLVKNAQEAIQAFADGPTKEPGWSGRIETIVRRNGDRVDIEVIDNGTGPAQAQSQPAARALRYHQRQQGHRARSRHRAKERRAARRHPGLGGCPGGARPHPWRAVAHQPADRQPAARPDALFPTRTGRRFRQCIVFQPGKEC